MFDRPHSASVCIYSFSSSKSPWRRLRMSHCISALIIVSSLQLAMFPIARTVQMSKSSSCPWAKVSCLQSSSIKLLPEVSASNILSLTSSVSFCKVFVIYAFTSMSFELSILQEISDKWSSCQSSIKTWSAMMFKTKAAFSSRASLSIWVNVNLAIYFSSSMSVNCILLNSCE